MPVTPAELEELKQRAQGIRLAVFLRDAALDRPLVIVPEANRIAWRELSRLAGNVNQITHALHNGAATSSTDGELLQTLKEVTKLLSLVRGLLLGKRPK